MTGCINTSRPVPDSVFDNCRLSAEQHGLEHEVLTPEQVSARFPGYRLPPGFKVRSAPPPQGRTASERCACLSFFCCGLHGEACTPAVPRVPIEAMTQTLPAMHCLLISTRQAERSARRCTRAKRAGLFQGSPPCFPASASSLRPAHEPARARQALHQREGGILAPERCVAAHAAAAAARGAVLREREAVTGWRVDADSGDALVTTARATYRGRRLVVTAGAWIPQLVPQLRARPRGPGRVQDVRDKLFHSSMLMI